MKKIVFSAVVVLTTIAAFGIVAPPPENYCKHDAARDTGICGIGSGGTAYCLTITSPVTTNKDCYGVHNE
jgi:hypothetical protein